MQCALDVPYPARIRVGDRPVGTARQPHELVCGEADDDDRDLPHPVPAERPAHAPMVGTIADMGPLVWLCLAFFVVVLAVGSWYTIRHGYRTYKKLQTLDSLGHALADAVAKLDEVPGHLDAAAASSERLTIALERLARSRRRLAILMAAFAEVRASVTGALAVVPRSK